MKQLRLCAWVLAGFITTAHAVRITDVTSGTVLFDNNGFEQDTLNKTPFKTVAGVISGKEQDKVFGVDSGGPGAFKGLQYACTPRDQNGAGNIEIKVPRAVTFSGQTLLMEWAWHLPSACNAKWGLRGDLQFYKSLWRAGNGSIQVSVDGKWEYRGYYTADKWLVCSLKYTIGERTADFTVDGVTMKLDVDNYKGGAPGVQGIFFSHNTQAEYYLDGTYETAVQPPSGGREEVNVDTRPELPEWIDVTWQRFPNTPRGIQWPAVGMIDNTFISAGGWCTGEEVASKPGIYPRGFFNDVFAMDVTAPDKGWSRLPDFPGEARMGTVCVTVNSKLYVWGGLSYTEPYCYTDGYVLAKENGDWVWTPLPPLPHALVFPGACAMGSKIYIAGGCDYNRKGFLSANSRDGTVPGIGQRLLVFDTETPAQGWKELALCPGTGRLNTATAAVNGKLYVMGGATGIDSPNAKVNTIVDNWCYDPVEDRWERLPDLPIASGNFPTGDIVYKNRYILLVGGVQFPNIQFPNGQIEKSQSFGLAKMFYPQFVKEAWRGKNQRYVSDIFVYDTVNNSFGEATMLPFNNNMTKFIVRRDNIYLISGETGGLIIDDEYYGHHPDFFLEGTLQIKPKNEGVSFSTTGTTK
ncbi:MAG: hypothetical protein WC959_02300 [Kiritimatiellales bacterium]